MEKGCNRRTSTATIIPGYSIAGKTGTANKVEKRKVFTKAICIILCRYGSCDNPKVTLILTVDDPELPNYYASLTAVPAAKTFRRVVCNIDIPPDKPEELIKEQEKEKVSKRSKRKTKRKRLIIMTIMKNQSLHKTQLVSKNTTSIQNTNSANKTQQ